MNIMHVLIVYPDRTEPFIPRQEGVQIIKDKRIFTRIPFARSFACVDDSGTAGTASVTNVGRGGMGVASLAPLRPASVVTVRFEDVSFNDREVELQAIVAWCNSEGDTYNCGLTWVQGERITLPAINAVYYSAIQDHVESGAAGSGAAGYGAAY